MELSFCNVFPLLHLNTIQHYPLQFSLEPTFALKLKFVSHIPFNFHEGFEKPGSITETVGRTARDFLAYEEFQRKAEVGYGRGV